MALVANPLPVDTMTIGKRVAYFDPTADAAGLKYGRITDVKRGTTTQAPILITVVAELGGTLTDQNAAFFRVVEKWSLPVNV